MSNPFEDDDLDHDDEDSAGDTLLVMAETIQMLTHQLAQMGRVNDQLRERIIALQRVGDN